MLRAHSGDFNFISPGAVSAFQQSASGHSSLVSERRRAGSLPSRLQQLLGAVSHERVGRRALARRPAGTAAVASRQTAEGHADSQSPGARGICVRPSPSYGRGQPAQARLRHACHGHGLIGGAHCHLPDVSGAAAARALPPPLLPPAAACAAGPSHAACDCLRRLQWPAVAVRGWAACACLTPPRLPPSPSPAASTRLSTCSTNGRSAWAASASPSSSHHVRVPRWLAGSSPWLSIVALSRRWRCRLPPPRPYPSCCRRTC